MLPPMTERFDLLIASMQQAARTVLILFALANAIILSRWSIKYIPAKYRTWALNAFDVWLITINLLLFITAQ
jgi:hypothetical protein